MLKGKSTIRLFDAKTGEETLCVEDNNMITNAVSNLLNPPAQWGFSAASGNLCAAMNYMAPVATNMLGGIMLWEDNIVENAATIFPPNDNLCVGHAGGEYAGTTATRGTYNTNESGAITDENENVTGYRHVWDFATDKANGNINCITLTSRGGGNSGWLPSLGGSGMLSFPYDFYGETVNSGSHIFPVSCINVSTAPIRAVVLARLSDGNFVCYDADTTKIKIVYACNGSSLPLTLDLSNVNNEYKVLKTYDVGGYPLSAGFISSSEMIFINTLSSTEITAKRINPLTGAILGTKSFSLIGTGYSFTTGSAETSYLSNFQNARSSIVYHEGYYYIANGVYIYKFKPDGTLLQRLDGSFTQSHWLCVCAGKLFAIYTSGSPSSDTLNYAINSDGTFTPVRMQVSGNEIIAPVFDGAPHAPYVLGQNSFITSFAHQNIGTSEMMIFRAYIGSINNLDVPILKTSAQTMKITYEIYQE